ncbi:MAG: UDP-N-acetylglucosamine 1-carboxyvinyltransferase [Candidatus Campbellbacteria bacterium]
MDPKTEAFRITGLNGEKKLSGEISVSGSKNNALPLLASSVLFAGPVSFSNVPDITDVDKMFELLRNAGAVVTREGDVVTVDPAGVAHGEIDVAVANKLRASIILTGSLLGRTRRITFPSPGGCVIGKRPIDLFLEGYTKLGATVTENENIFTVSADKLSGMEFFFRLQSVTGTEALLMASALAHGTTTLKNVALEPEVTDLAEFLRDAGASIEGVGTNTLTIHGTGGIPLKNNSKEPHRVIPDRIEAGSYLVLGALCAHDLTLKGCNPSHLELPIITLQEMGVPVEVRGTDVVISNNTKPNNAFLPASIRTHEYPGFPTDLQSPYTVLCTQAEGESVIEEMIFEGRLAYTADLVSMGADITVAHPHKAVVKGPAKLSGRELYTPDLRAGLAYIIAACVGKGVSLIHNIHYVDRGYENAEAKLRQIGVAIERVSV